MSQSLLALPVSNGLLPRPGGSVAAVFLSPGLIPALIKAGVGSDVFLMLASAGRDPYPVGVVAQVTEIWMQDVFALSGGGLERVSAVFLRLFGRQQAKAKHFRLTGKAILALEVEPLDLVNLRPEYPCISGAGYVLQGGNTESRGSGDVQITLMGTDSERELPVLLQASVGDLISYQQAHTVEHALIRSLQVHAFCSPLTLRQSMGEEGEELLASIEAGIASGLPELFGVTQSGACGNPLTSLAKVYLAEEYIANLQAGTPYLPAIEQARRKTLSRLTSDLSLTTQAGLRTLQGLHKGMMHDHTPLSDQLARRILSRFPVSPWA